VACAASGPSTTSVAVTSAPRHPRQDGGQVRVVGARDDGAVERHLVGEVDERLLQVVEPAVVFEMLVVDVRHHRNRRKQFQKRSIAFVRLGDHQLSPPEPRVAAEGAHPAADDRRRIEPRPFEDDRDHRRRRRLAVRACHRDAVAKPHQLREHLGARNHRNLPERRFAHLGVRRTDGRGNDDDLGVAHVARIVAVRHADPQRLETIGHRRSLFIRAAHHVAEIGEQFGDAAHTDAANPDEVNAPRFA
jgi:hypothetical protein